MKPDITIEELLQDPSFQAWINGDPAATTIWLDWLAQNPGMQLIVRQAQTQFQSRQSTSVPDSDQIVQVEEGRLLVLSEAPQSQRVIGEEFMPLWPGSMRWLRIAASVALVLGLGIGYYLLRHAEEVKMAVVHTLKNPDKIKLAEGINQTNKPTSDRRLFRRLRLGLGQ